MQSTGEAVVRRYVDVERGRRLAYWTFGARDGTPVVAFHGCPISGRAFGWLSAEAAAAGFSVICPDRPGCGGSDPKPDRTYLDWPNDVRQLADRLGLDRLLLLGWSSGGPYAAACAARLADRVQAVALVAGIAPPTASEVAGTLSADWRRLYWLCRHAPRPARAYLASQLRQAQRNAPRFNRKLDGYFPAQPDRDYIHALRTQIGELAVAAPFADTVQHGAGWIVEDQLIEAGPWSFDLADIAVPVRIWHGGDDQTLNPAHSRYLAEHVRTATLTVLPDAGHLLLYQHTRDVLADLQSIAVTPRS